MTSLISKVLIGTCLMLGTTQAAQITLTGLGFGRTDVAMEVNGNAGSHYAIQIYLTKNNAINYTAYCVDLFTSIGFSTYNTSTGLPSTLPPNGQRAAWVFDTYRNTVGTNEEAAALQVAWWDIVHDGGDGLSNGNIKLAASESALQLMADAMVTASLGHTSNNATILYNFNMGDNSKAQTLITTADALTPNPEPQSMAMMALGVAMLWFGSRKRLALR
jgi:hypothetical protein